MQFADFAKTKSLIQDKTLVVSIITILALLIGYQIYDPSKRMIEAAVGIVFVALIAKYNLIWALSFFILLYPFPFALRVGTSNVVFLPVMIIIWLIRVSLRNVERPRGSLLDWVLILMTISYLVSFYNNPGGGMMTTALVFFLAYLTAVGLFYLIVNFVRDEKTLVRIVNAGVISSFLVMVFCVLEMIFPGRALVPGWLYTAHKQALVMKNVRVEGPFSDFELVAEYLALNMPILILLYVRSKRMLYRYSYFAIILLCLGLLMATSTRGAFISLGIGIVYMLFVIRRDLNIVRIFTILTMIIGLTVITDMLITKYTISGGMFFRLSQTKFVGFIPDTRKYAWPKAMARAKKHIIIGHSPAWDFTRKLEQFNWPHNGYLFYLNITGIFGLLTFLLLLFTLLRSSVKLKAGSMFDKSFPRSLMLVLHVILVIFIIDEIKIDYLRNKIYIYFIWYIFGLIAATHNVIMEEGKQNF